MDGRDVAWPMDESTSSNLYRALSPCLLPIVRPIVMACVNAVVDLPGLRNWVPAEVNLLVMRRILSWGLPLSLLADVPSLGRLRQEIATAILKAGEPGVSDLSEISGAGLCRTLGADLVSVPRRKKTKTPDFTALWPSDRVDLEVTRGDQKPEHRWRLQIAAELAKRIHSNKREHDLILHLSHPPTAAEESAIMEASLRMARLNESGEPGKWHLRAGKPDRPPGVLLPAGKIDELPPWWPQSEVRYWTLCQTFAGPSTAEPPPQTRVAIGVPMGTYVNPVQNKADRPQGTGRSFLIAIDVQNLPGAFPEFTRALPSYFSIWSHVSGVLAFEPLVNTDRIGWSWQLFVNPQATHPLPAELIRAQGSHPNESLETVYSLVGDNSHTESH